MRVYTSAILMSLVIGSVMGLGAIKLLDHGPERVTAQARELCATRLDRWLYSGVWSGKDEMATYESLLKAMKGCIEKGGDGR